MRTPREPWPCAHCSTLNLSTARSCRRCGTGRAILLERDAAGSPGLAAICSGLVPGLGQVYQERWVRGIMFLLFPILAVALAGAFIATFDPLTSLVIRHAVLFTFAVVGGLLLYHLIVVADAFAGGFRHGGTLRGKHVADYFALALVTIGLIAGYGSVYRSANAWAGLATKVFAPVAGATARGATTVFAPPPWNGADRMNLLILGIDSRGIPGDTVNTDTMIVLSLDPLNRTGAMLSIPRDTIVPIKGHGQDKVNSAYAYGGPELAKKTVENFLGIGLNSYAILNFDAFTKIVDSVGGVLIDVKRPIRDDSYPTMDFGVQRLAIAAGPQLMDGDIALKYARSRHDSNDFSRARRQQDVISALRGRFAADGMLGRLPEIIGNVGTLIETNFDPANVLPIASLTTSLPANAITSQVLLPCGAGLPHCELTEQNDPLGYYLFPDKAKVANIVAELFYDPRVRQEGARLEIRGATAKRGQAQDVADRLAARAFGVGRVTTAAAGRSEILVKNGAKRYTADQLSQQLSRIPVRDAAAEQTDADIVVVVGSDFRGFATDLLR